MIVQKVENMLFVVGAQELQDHSPVKHLRHQSEIEGGSLSLDDLVEDVATEQDTNPRAPPPSPVLRDDLTIELPSASRRYGNSQEREVVETGTPCAASGNPHVGAVQETSPKAPPSTPVSRDDPTIELQGTSGSHGKSEKNEVVASGTPPAATGNLHVASAPRNAQGKVTVKEMVAWISADHKPLKLPEIEEEEEEEDTIEISEASNSASQDREEGQTDETSQSFETHPRVVDVSDKHVDSQKPSSVKTRVVHRKKSLQGMSPEELQSIEDYQFLALAKRDLKHLEAEIEHCCQGTGGLHGGVRKEMERIIESALLTIKHGGDMDVNQAIEYNDKLLEMKQQFECLSSRLQKARIDLASIKQVVSDCARLRCKCWWCRSYNSMRKLFPGSLIPNHLRNLRRTRKSSSNSVGTFKS